MLGRYCGQQSPPDIRSSGRYLWIKFVTDGELEAVGFSATYNFTAGALLFSLFVTTVVLFASVSIQGYFSGEAAQQTDQC